MLKLIKIIVNEGASNMSSTNVMWWSAAKLFFSISKTLIIRNRHSTAPLQICKAFNVPLGAGS